MCSKTKTNTQPMCEVLDKDTIKSEFLHICLCRNVVVYQKTTWRKSLNTFSTSRKPAFRGRLFLHFHDVVSVGREQHGLQRLTLAVVSVRVFCAVAHARVCDTATFCLVFSKNFNIMSVFLFTNRSLGRKYSILAKVGFDAKRG